MQQPPKKAITFDNHEKIIGLFAHPYTLLPIEYYNYYPLLVMDM